MSIRNRSRGITFIGFLVVLAVVGFFVYLGMRLVPMYIEYMGEVRSEPGAANMSPEQVRRSLQFKFDAQYVESGAIPPEAIQVIRQGNAQTLRIRYERRVPFIHNLEILGTFDKSVNLSGADD
jgi:Tfp pilus assembly protein PilE